jgi:opacity protein-like surface antigen
MKRTRVLIILALIAILSTTSFAQRKELMAFAGYRTGGSFNVASTDYLTFEIEDGFNFGLALGLMISPVTEIEFMWSQTNSKLSGYLISPILEKGAVFDIHTSQFHVNFLFLFPQGNKRLVPYFLFGLGLTYADPKGEPNGETRFSYSLGGGLKAMINERMGIRLQAKWNPTYINTSSELWVDYWGFVYAIPVSQYMSQGEFTGGIFFRF